MAMASVLGRAVLVPKCNTSGPKQHSISTRVIATSSSSSASFCKSNDKRGIRITRALKISASEKMATSEVVEEKLGVKIQRNPPESKLFQLGVRNWPKWGCPPSKFPWTYSSKETCYLLKGKVKVYPDGSDEVVEFGAGDLVEFPNGMSCTWDISETIDKHYKFE